MMRYFRRFHQPILAGIDIGSTKLCCWISLPEENGIFKIIGSSCAQTKGFFGGHITDIQNLEAIFYPVLNEAEKCAGTKISDIFLTFSAPFFKSKYHTINLCIPDEIISEQNLSEISSSPVLKLPQYYPLHIIPLEFQVDSQKKIKNPIKMAGNTLSSKVHVIYAPEITIKTFIASFRRCNVNVKEIIPAGFSSSLSCLVPDEKTMGSTLIDIGAGTTSISIFVENRLTFIFSLPIGSAHITQDIARGLETPMDHAERLKILYGSALSGPEDYREMIPLAPLGAHICDEPVVARSFLSTIIQARLEEIFLLIKRQISSLDTIFPFATSRIILTGGGSLLSGIREFGQKVLEKSVHLGKPMGISGLSSLKGDSSAIAGIFHYAKLQHVSQNALSTSRNKTFFSSWLKRKL